MQIKGVLSVIAMLFSVAFCTLYVREVNEMTFTCNRSNNLITIMINYDNGKQDLVATFNNTSCTTFGYMRCFYNTFYVLLAIPVKYVVSKMASYSCNNYITYSVYNYDATEFNAANKTNVSLVCPSSIDHSLLTLKYSNGQEEIMGYFKVSYTKCGLEMNCSIGDNKNIVHFVKKSSTVSLDIYGCASFLMTSVTNVALTQSDTQGKLSFTLACSKNPFPDTVAVTKKTGQTEIYATYLLRNCSVWKPSVSCSMTSSEIILTVPVTTESRTIASYSCYAGHSEEVVFYKAATSVSCQRPTISSTGESLVVNCQAIEFYPRLTCVLYELNNSIQSYTVEYGNLVDSGRGFYYNSTCTLKMPISQLQQGSRQYGVVLTAATLTLGQNEYQLEKINIAPLGAVLDNSCTEGQGMINGYIQNTSTIKCTCRRDSKSNTFGQVFWYTDNAVVLSTTNTDNSSTLTVSYSTSFRRVYQCKALPIPDSKYAPYYIAQFAYGPTQVTGSRSTLLMNICSSETFTCFVDPNNVSPGVVFNSSTDSPYLILRLTGSANLSATYAVKALRAGNYTVSCTATNTLFNINARRSVAVRALDVPLQDPVVIVNNNNPITEASEAVNITCYVSESVVAVKDVTINCFGSSQTAPGSKVTMLKKFSRDNSGMCFCAVQYVDDCYTSKKKDFQIMVVYGPKRLQISESHLAIEVCASETISCSVLTTDFNPNVNFVLTSNSPTSLSIERLKTNSTHGNATFVITAQKSGEYTVTCRATNSIVSEMYAENSIVVSAEELISRIPVLSVINKQLPLMEGDASTNVKIFCTIPGRFQGVKILTMNCFGSVLTTVSEPILIEKNLTRATNDMICNCVAQYSSQCLGQRVAKLDLKIMFGPSQAFLYPKSIDMEKCDQVTVGCNVLKADVYPVATFLISSTNAKAFEFDENSRMANNVSATLNVTALMAGNFTLTCYASNNVFNSIRTETTIPVIIKEYPLKPPVFIVNDGNPITDKSVLNSLSILCVAGVNKRSLSKLTISCPNVTVTSKTSTVKIYKDITQDTKGTDCSCLAEYNDTCNGYTKSEVHFEFKCTQPMLFINNNKPIIPGASGSRIPVVCKGIEDTNTESNITLTCLGSSQTSVGTTISIEKDVTQKDNGALCSCSIDSKYCKQTRTVQAALNVSYFGGILRFTTQGYETLQKIKENEKLTFTCIVESNPKPKILLKDKDKEIAEIRNGDRITDTETTSGIWEYRLEVNPVSCADTGNYSCYAENLITATNAMKTSEIIVRCPFKVANEEAVQRKFIGYLDKTAVVSVNVYGYPLPNSFQLRRGSNNPVDQNHFSFTYKELAKPNILVSLKIYNLKEDNFTSYTIIIENEEGQLQYQFSIVKDTLESSNNSTSTIIAVTVSLLAAVMVGAVGIYMYRRRQRNQHHVQGPVPETFSERQDTAMNNYTRTTEDSSKTPNGSDASSDLLRFSSSTSNEEGRRAAGRQILRYTDACKRDMKHFKIDTSNREDLALDRSTLRESIKEGSSTEDAIHNRSRKKGENATAPASSETPDRSDASSDSQSTSSSNEGATMRVINGSVKSEKLENEKIRHLSRIHESDVDSNKCDSDI